MVDERHFRDVLGNFASGLTVIAAVADGAPVGLTCQSFFSLSLHPPLVAFSVGLTSTSYPAISAVGSCVINVLASDQHALSDSFARSKTDKWAGVSWQPGPATGNPVISGALAWFECEIRHEYEAGDHWLVVAHVKGLGHRATARPLLYFRGSYADVREGGVDVSA